MIYTSENDDFKIIEIECNCVSDCRRLIFFKDKETKCVCISTRALGGCAIHDFSLWNRIKECFKILFKKKLYFDDIILEEKEFAELSKVLKEM